MSAVWFRVAVWMRRRTFALISTAVVIGLVSGVALALVAGTRRTASAPDRYTAWAGGDPDLLITQEAGLPLTDRIAALPGVTDAQSYSFVLSFPVAPTDGAPLTDLNPFAGSDDVDGARVIEGRFADPDAPYEFTANRQLADELRRRFDTEVGDRFEFVSYTIDQVRENVDPEDETPAAAPFTGTLVGITESPSEFDEAGAQLVLSPAFLDVHRNLGIVQSLIAVKTRPGTDHDELLDAVHLMSDGPGAYSLPVRVVSDSARRAVRYQALALWLVSGLALAAAAVLAAQIATRALLLRPDEHGALASVGWRRRDVAMERAIEGAAIGMAAVPIAAVIGYLGTAFFPLGILRTFEPHAGPRLDLVVLGLGLPLVVAVVSATGAMVGLRASHPGRGALAAPAARVPAGASMPLAVGFHFAASSPGGGRPWRAVIAGVVAVAGITGSVLVGSAIDTIIDSPARWGVNFDSMLGNPFAPAVEDFVTPLADLDHVEAVTGAHLGSVTIEGVDTGTIAVDPAKGNLLPTVLEGRSPYAVDEIGIGAEVARRVGAEVGDRVEVVGLDGVPRRMRVVGIVVTPDAAGEGSTMTFESYIDTNGEATRHVAFVRFRPGTPDSAIATARRTAYSPPDSLAELPVSIRALERVTAAPFLLGGVFAFMLLVSSAYLLTASVRARSSQYATLRALGADRRQLREVVRWQALLATGAMVVFGVPLGVLASHSVIRSVTDTLGIVPIVDVGTWLVVACVVVPLGVAGLLSVLPGRRAAGADVAFLSHDR